MLLYCRLVHVEYECIPRSGIANTTGTEYRYVRIRSAAYRGAESMLQCYDSSEVDRPKLAGRSSGQHTLISEPSVPRPAIIPSLEARMSDDTVRRRPRVSTNSRSNIQYQ